MWELVIAAALQFPEVEARDLNGRVVSSRELRGAPVVLALGFSYESRHQVEPWKRAIADETSGRLRVIVMPVYRGMPGPVRGLVDGAMAGATPASARGDVWTTTEYDLLARRLGLGGAGEKAAVVLLDGTGQVRHVSRGAPTPAALRALIDAWSALPAAGE